MSVVLARIDQRMIHGIVVTQWAGATKAKRLMVVDNEVSKDEVQKALNSAKAYADSLADNYDPKGAAARALNDAKTYMNGQIKSDGIIVASSTSGSTKKFKITVNDEGTLTATVVTT